MLKVRDLMVFFENALAINGLSLKVQRGEIVGVLGSNSAGKTILMNTISGLIIDMKRKEDRRGGRGSRSSERSSSRGRTSPPPNRAKG